MSSKEAKKAVSFNLKRYPMNLLVPSVENILSFQVINYLNKRNKYQFNIQGENLNIDIPEVLKKEIKFEPSETKEFSINLRPIIDGQGKLIISVSSLKEVKKKVKIHKIRNRVERRKLKEIARKYIFDFAQNIDSFNHNDYFIPMQDNEIKAAEERIENDRNRGINVDQDIERLAKAYLAQNNIQKALEISLTILDEHKKYNFYYDLIRAYAKINFDSSIQIIENLQDKEKQFFLIKNLALEQVESDPEKASQLVLLIEDPLKKNPLLIDVIARTISIDPSLAYNLSHLIRDEFSIAKILINVAEKFEEINNKPESIKILNQILNIFIKSNIIDLSTNKFKNPAYDFVRDILQEIAEIDSPATANSIIEGFTNVKLKKRIQKDLDDDLFENRIETQILLEPTNIFSQYFIFNTLISINNEDIKYFSSIGGNISNNLLIRNNNFRLAIVSLFSYDFSIFPTMERLNADFNEAFAYYIFPSIDKLKGNESSTLTNTLNHFFNPNGISNQVFILNLDFIPYLGKPSIIISSQDDYLKSKIESKLGKNINLYTDDSIFMRGSSLTKLQHVFNPHRFKVLNLLLSYEFINDYNIFKTLIHALIS